MRATSADRVNPASPVAPVSGLPQVNYYLPMLVTLLSAVVLLLFLAAISLITLLTSITQIGRFAGNDPQANYLTLGFCGLVGIGGSLVTAYFLVTVIKGVRDLFTPLYFTRGTVADKRVIGGRKTGNWLGVFPAYAGPDLDQASAVNEEQRAASTDRTQALQPRYSSTAGAAPRKPSSYLSADRISAEPAPTRTSVKSETGERRPRRIFRVDPASHAALEAGEEVLVAHSRFLEHIFYVARLRNGEWEAYKNKALI